MDDYNDTNDENYGYKPSFYVYADGCCTVV